MTSVEQPTVEAWKEAAEAVRAYGHSRRSFQTTQAKHPILLGGNDNKVGVCGEFWAKWYYHRKGYQITEVPCSNTEGYDFRCKHGQEEIRISVKVVSDENKNGRQLQLKDSPNWDELVLVLLDDLMYPYRMGIATREQFNQAKRNKVIGSRPSVSRSWVAKRGWMSRYGKVEEVKV